MKYHVPVLLNESVNGLSIKPSGTYVDLTFGGGGHDSTDGHWDYILGNFNQAVASSRVRALSVNYSGALSEMIGTHISWRGDLA